MNAISLPLPCLRGALLNERNPLPCLLADAWSCPNSNSGDHGAAGADSSSRQFELWLLAAMASIRTSRPAEPNSFEPGRPRLDSCFPGFKSATPADSTACSLESPVLETARCCLHAKGVVRNRARPATPCAAWSVGLTALGSPRWPLGNQLRSPWSSMGRALTGFRSSGLHFKPRASRALKQIRRFSGGPCPTADRGAGRLSE